LYFWGAKGYWSLIKRFFFEVPNYPEFSADGGIVQTDGGEPFQTKTKLDIE